jgi:hypothetical protein
MQMQIIIEHILRSEKMNYLNHNEKSVIFWIGSYMGNKMVSWPSNEELARLLSKSVKTVQRAIKSLELKNILFVERKHRQNNIYTFNPNWLAIFDSLDIKVGKLGRQNDFLGRQNDYSRATNSRSNNISNNINNNGKSYPQADQKPKSKAWSGLTKTASKASDLLESYMKEKH